MKCCIAYASTHHGNTKKVVDVIAKEFEVVAMMLTGSFAYPGSHMDMKHGIPLKETVDDDYKKSI